MSYPVRGGTVGVAESEAGRLLRVRPKWGSLRSAGFWRTQALVAAATGILYGFNFLYHPAVGGGWHDVLAMAYMAPVLYAALTFGLEGALLTSLWSAALIAPHAMTIARDDYEWLGDLGTLTVISVTGAFLASHVEMERAARRRAEFISERLRFLNELATALDRPMDVPALLQELVDRLRHTLRLDYAWVRYVPTAQAADTHLATSGVARSQRLEIEAASVAASMATAATSLPLVTGDGTVIVALAVEGRFIGALAAHRSTPIDEDGRAMLSAAAAQASATIESQRLQRNRRELLTSYARQVTNAQEDERRRIAREIHDGPMQTLSGLCRGLDIVRAELDEETSPAATIRTLRSIAEDTVADLRRLARDLRPGVLDDLGLMSAIGWLAEDFRERTGHDIRVTFEGEPTTLTDSQELGVFRIVQEALRNVEKHAQASTVEVALEWSEEGLHLEVRDDGIGFHVTPEVETASLEVGYGILGMRERARLNGGHLGIVSHAGAGTMLTLDIETTH